MIVLIKARRQVTEDPDARARLRAGDLFPRRGGVKLMEAITGAGTGKVANYTEPES